MRHDTKPFELLKLIRDGVLTNSLMLTVIANSSTIRYYRHYLDGLSEVGLITVSDKEEITPTAKLDTFLSALDLSLTQLANLRADSVVCSPAFGSPSAPATQAEIFVVMPFSCELQPIYTDHMKTVAEKLNRSIARADDFFTAGSVISDIWDGINAAKIVLADCSGRNPNVFYEIGMAHTLGKPVILTAQKKDDIPFDVQHIRAILYDFTPRGMQDYEENLFATLDLELNRRRSSLEDRFRLMLSPQNEDG